MKFEVNPIKSEEQLYMERQSVQISGQTGFIGYLRGEFGSGTEFYTSWFPPFDRKSEYQTNEFDAEFDEVVNGLRAKDRLLCTRDSMTKLCYQHPEAEIEGNYCTLYGFKVQTAQYTYLIRYNPNYGDYNFYIFAYVARFLQTHLEKAKQGIRFITPDYKEKFRIPDGDFIRIYRQDGSYGDRKCRYIDEYHAEIGNTLYHVCQFAEVMEQNGNTVIPLRSSLPVQCFSTLPSSGELILLTRGEKGYTPCPEFSVADAQENRKFAEDNNGKNGITKAQEAAMLAGSMFGWQAPAANPKNYDENGHLIKKPGGYHND